MSEAPSVVHSSVKQPCSRADYDHIGCLNGGTCFQIPFHNESKIIGCSCTKEWDGTRCEFRFVDPEILAHDASMASIAAGVTVGLFLLLAFIAGVAIYWRKYRRNRGQSNAATERSMRVSDHENASPGESKLSYEACLATESPRILTVGPETSPSKEYASLSSFSSPSSSAIPSTANVVSKTRHLSADCPFIDED